MYIPCFRPIIRRYGKDETILSYSGVEMQPLKHIAVLESGRAKLEMLDIEGDLFRLESYESGDVFRSACCFERGYGKIFYFQPGHETLRSYYNSNVQLILRNAARWAARDRALDRPLGSEFAPPLEEKK